MKPTSTYMYMYEKTNNLGDLFANAHTDSDSEDFIIVTSVYATMFTKTDSVLLHTAHRAY